MPRTTSRFRLLLETVGSVRLGVVLLTLLAVSSVLGTVILQSTLPGGDPVSISRHYGETVYRVLEALRLTDVFHAPWYHALMGLVAVNLLSATITRFSLRPGKWGFLLAHAGVLVTLLGGLVYFTRGDKGVLMVAEGEATSQYVSRRSRTYEQLPFSVRLDRFDIDYYPAELVIVGPDDTTVSVRPREGGHVELPWHGARLRCERLLPGARRVTEIVPPTSTSPDNVPRIETRYVAAGGSKSFPGTPAVLLDVSMSSDRRYRFWMSTDGPDRRVKLGGAIVIEYVRQVREYRSLVTVAEKKGVRTLLPVGPEGASHKRVLTPFFSGVIRVNHPVSHAGWQIFQEGYFPQENGTVSQLALSRDPGLPLAYVGLTLLTVGVFYACFVKPVVGRKFEARSSKHETSTKFK